MSAQAHHPLGFSAAHRWMPCSGSVALSAQYPDKAGDEAAEGTQAHDLAEALLRRKETEWAPADMVDFVREYTEGVRDPDWLRHMLGLPADTRVELVKEWVEERVSLPLLAGAASPEGDLGEVFSTLDHAAVWAIWDRAGDQWPTRFVLVVSDLKYGMGVPVEAKDNPQTRLYLAGMGQIADLYYPISRYVGVIYQPRLESRTFEVLDAAELDAFVALASDRALATLAPHAPLVPGEKQCRWCKAKADCPARAAYTRAALAADFAALDALEEGTAGIGAPDPADFDPEELGRALRAVPLVKQWVSAVETAALERLKEGEPVPGWKLVEGRSNRRWASTDLAEARLLGAGLGMDDVWERELISPAKAEKALGKKVFKAADLGELIDKPRGSATLAPEDDPRPPYHAVATAADFDA